MMDGEQVKALYLRGIEHMERREIDAAAATFLAVIAHTPDHADAHYQLSNALLMRGEFRPGWHEYVWWHKLDGAKGKLPRLAAPLWNGMRLPRGRILLLGDQGYGDTIQFARYLPLVAERCGELVIGCDPALTPLLPRIP
ncbi:MAG TPA: glycosyltransferase, partial [Stellaceae bacterium]|nr:glycosyltransferase [Stellaceae bacterium]